MTISTKLTKAASNRESLRTTVPHEVVTELGLQEGDSIEWIFEKNTQWKQKWFLVRKSAIREKKTE